DQLMISSEGSADDQFSVFFDSVEQGRRLRVTRRIYDAQLGQPILVRSFYNKTSGVARFSIYGEPESSPASTAADDRRTTRDAPAQSARTTNQEVRRQTPARPVFRPAPPTPRRDPREEVFTIGTNAQFVATLNDDLSTATSREGDRFTLTVREPAAFAGATIEGTVARIRRGGRISGRSEMTLNFERIRLGDGRTAEFTAAVESVRPAGGEEVRVDNESNGGEVQEGDSQTDRTTERAALGAAVGAIIGAISGGGKGAAIGAVIGAGAGAGSVYAQGRDDLELRRGSELVVRTTMR
ncbi:MAG TPA: YMGG-like glycine zipper-containing protein, partial [Pyrinomonadaceae bacterium]|nr:YMGG-like glycine zipper-containing protein [Pyrinomonadaceae bacterium]